MYMWDIMAKWHKRVIITALFGAHEFIFMHFNAIATQKLQFQHQKLHGIPFDIMVRYFKYRSKFI